MIPIVRGEADGRRVVLTTSEDRIGFLGEPPAWIRVENGDLIVEYWEPEFATEAVYRLLRLLDREHPFYGATPNRFEDDREQAVYERAELIEAVLDDREELGM